MAFLLIFISQAVAYPPESGPISPVLPSESADSIPANEFNSPVSSYLFGIQVNNSSQIITEIHKWGVLIVHRSQVVPLDFDFRRFADYPIPTIYSSPVPIFIRGHALLN
jgi:hypothetical protein